jgi:acetyl esterase
VIDPQVQKILYWAQRSPGPTYPQMGVQAARESYARAVLTLDVAPLPMHAVHEHRLDLPGRSIGARQYVPFEHGWAHPQPALLFFHGGGFTIGSLETHDRLCRVLAAAGRCHVYAIDYRLAPEHRFPAAADDAFDALDWLLAQSGSLGVDTERIAVGGDSAGGTLAAATALHARDNGVGLALQLLIYPGMASRQDSESHRRLAHGHLLDADVIQWFFDLYVRNETDRDDWRFAPLQAASVAGVAPAWIALAEYDPLVDEGLAYAQRLREAGVAVECTVFEGMIHAFFQHGGFVPAVRRAHAAAGVALRTAFRIED